MSEPAWESWCRRQVLLLLMLLLLAAALAMQQLEPTGFWRAILRPRSSEVSSGVIHAPTRSSLSSPTRLPPSPRPTPHYPPSPLTPTPTLNPPHP